MTPNSPSCQAIHRMIFLSQSGLIFSLLVILLGSCQPKTTEVSEAESSEIDHLEKGIKETQFQYLNGSSSLLFSPEKKLTVIHFWATWCKPCLEEFPELQKALPRLENDSTQFFIATDEDLDQIRTYQENHVTGLELVRLEGSSLADFEIYAMPSTIILDHQGREIYRKVGMMDWQAITSIPQLLLEKP